MNKIFFAPIALFAPSMRGGGAERVMLDLATFLVRQGIAIDLVLSKAEGEYLSRCPEDVRIIDLAAPKVSLSLFSLSQYLRKTRPCVLLSTMLNANLTAVCAVALAGTRTPVVLRVENTMSETATSIPDRILLSLARRLYKKSNALVAVSKGVADNLVSYLGLPRDAITVIYNPVVTPELLSLAQQDPDHPWTKKSSPPFILGVGRLTHQKNFPLLIRAFSGIAKHCNARLIILGEGPARNTLETLIAALGLSDRVALPGFVSNPFSFMRRAAVFVLSSNFEGLPSTLIQAMACECPVIATDCPSGPAEILNDGEYGYLVPMKNSEAMADTLLKVLRGNRLSVPPAWLRQFRADEATERYRKLLAQLVAKP